MTTHRVMISQENYQGFQGVLPPDLVSGKERVAVGCCDEEGTVLGAVSVNLIGFQYTIDWIYVEEEIRRKGVGSDLMAGVFDVIMGTGEYFPLSAFFPASSEREDLYWFFKSVYGMTVSFSHKRYHIRPEEIRESKALHLKVKERPKWQDLFELPIPVQKQVLSQLHRQGQYEVSDFDEWKEGMIQELCRCAFLGDKLAGVILVTGFSEDMLLLSYLYSTNAVVLSEGLLQTVKILEQSFPEKGLVFDTLTEESQKLAGKLFPEAECEEIYEAVWM